MTNLENASVDELARALVEAVSAQKKTRLLHTEQEIRYGHGLYIDPSNVYDSHGFKMVDAAVGLREVQRLRDILDLHPETHYTVWEVIETAADQLESLKNEPT